MAKSYSQIMGQIEMLQKEAAALQSSIIARIKKEIAQHGLTAEQLFSVGGGSVVRNGKAVNSTGSKRRLGKKASKGAAKPPKFADDQGNVWGGMGKRPEWIRAALDSGRSIEDFLVTKKKAASPAKATASKVATAPKANAKTLKTKSKAQPVSTDVPVTRPAAKTAAKRAKSAKKVVARKSSPAKKATKPKKVSKVGKAPVQAGATTAPQAAA